MIFLLGGHASSDGAFRLLGCRLWWYSGLTEPQGHGEKESTGCLSGAFQVLYQWHRSITMPEDA